MKTLEGQRRLQAADDRINRSIAEHIEEQDQVPPVHGGGVDESVPGPPDAELKFENLDASEQRMDVDDPAGADEPVGGSPGYPAAADVPTPMCRDGQEPQAWSSISCRAIPLLFDPWCCRPLRAVGRRG